MIRFITSVYVEEIIYCVFAVKQIALLDFCSEMCVRSSSEETNTNELEERPNIENMYDNAIVLAAATDDTTDVHGEKSQSVYQDLSIGARRAEPIFYETIKPRVLPKPPLRGESHAWPRVHQQPFIWVSFEERLKTLNSLNVSDISSFYQHKVTLLISI